MKIGILTFHDGMNHGGFLQAYALMRYLRECGADAKIIHYRNRTHLLREYQGLLVRFNPVNIARNMAKIWMFKRAQRRMTLTRFTTSVADVAAMGFDAIVIGSDIVWNFEWPFLGGDRIYFGHGLENSRLVAYAPSFGEAASATSVPDDIVEGLKTFDALSVRDDQSLKMLKTLLPDSDAHTVLDPTFLIDWNTEAKLCNVPARYLLVYAFQLRPEEIAAARRYADQQEMTTIAVGYRQRWCDQQRVSACPFEFLYYFQKSTAVLTSTFHGTLFALHFRRTFHTSCNDAIEPKTRGLLARLDIEDRIGKDGSLVARHLGTAPDYDRVETILSDEKQQSKEFLRNALGL